MYSKDDKAVPPTVRGQSTAKHCVSSCDGQTLTSGDRLALVLRYAGLRLLEQTKKVDIFCFSCLAPPWFHLGSLCRM